MRRGTHDPDVLDGHQQPPETIDERGTLAQWTAVTQHACSARRRTSALGARQRCSRQEPSSGL